MSDALEVEVAIALPQSQFLVTVSLSPGATVQDAIDASGLAGNVPGFDTANAPAGIWGRPVTRDHAVQQGDRVELYRELELDPREARRQLARAGRTMREGGYGDDQSRGSSS